MSTSHYKIFCRLSVGNILVILLVFACTASSSESYAKIKAPKVQSQKRDTTKVYNAKEVIIDGYSSLGGVERMPDVKNGIIYAGKKTEVIQLDKILADVSTNNARQVFAKVPGISIWENDGSGIQVGVAARGLSPNRSWEFNVRQNGYDISSEAFGYPEAYYNPPMEALERIEVVRGAASLQYGTQFGGLLNYQIKKGTPFKTISFETQQTVGTNGLFNSYNALGGTYKDLSYYAYLHHRSADGWRDNSRYNVLTGYLSANFKLTNDLTIGADYTSMDYQSQQAGGLTDVKFNENPRQSFRERNWFGTPWNVASLYLNYQISPTSVLRVTAFGTFAERNSVGFTQAITTQDTINLTTHAYNSRQVDRDSYKNYGTEARISMKYKFLGNENTFAGGIRAYQGNTERKQLGVGTTGDDFDLTLSTPAYGRMLKFSTTNYAVFAENIFVITNGLKIIPGVRLDLVHNTIEGYINSSPSGQVTPDSRDRTIVLYGIGGEYQLTEKTSLYGNYSRSYRPVTYSELTPSATTEIIDPNLTDASGYNIDFGYRGAIDDYLNFDIGAFSLRYNNRIGTITQNNAPLKTNIGTSESKGIESYIEVNPLKFLDITSLGSFSIFASNSFIKAEYTEWNNPAIAGDPAKSIAGKQVENSPDYIHRFGATYSIFGLSATLQINSVGEVYTDAANTEAPTATATAGKLPGYSVMDLTVAYVLNEQYTIKAGVNNLSDTQYATRRSGGYPGPGILPANGRTMYLTFGAKL
ncbi:MAG: TonB-dependent receptor [Candidatus Kapaibacterium sp.]